jgi:hypothetical protein
VYKSWIIKLYIRSCKNKEQSRVANVGLGMAGRLFPSSLSEAHMAEEHRRIESTRHKSGKKVGAVGGALNISSCAQFRPQKDVGGFSLGQISWLGCPAKLVSIRNNRNWNRNEFRYYPKQDVCFGSISKQRVSVFRLNRNKAKTTETNRKIVIKG